jgi:hypothetical protein
LGSQAKGSHNTLPIPPPQQLASSVDYFAYETPLNFRYDIHNIRRQIQTRAI